MASGMRSRRQNLVAAEVAAVGHGGDLLAARGLLRLQRHGGELVAIVSLVDHLVGDDQMVLGIDRDLHTIHDLFTRYCCALDNGEIEAMVDCFTVDAILKSPVIDISGRDEIRAFAGRFAAQRAAGTQFRHMVSNIAVTITGNRAAASAYLLVLISKGGNHHSLPPGRYACELIKEDSGRWRFSRRTVFHDHDYTLDGIGR